MSWATLGFSRVTCACTHQNPHLHLWAWVFMGMGSGFMKTHGYPNLHRGLPPEMMNKPHKGSASVNWTLPCNLARIRKSWINNTMGRGIPSSPHWNWNKNETGRYPPSLLHQNGDDRTRRHTLPAKLKLKQRQGRGLPTCLIIWGVLTGVGGDVVVCIGRVGCTWHCRQVVGHGNGGFGHIQLTNGNLADWVWVVLARVDIVSWLMWHWYEAGSLVWVDVVGFRNDRWQRVYPPHVMVLLVSSSQYTKKKISQVHLVCLPSHCVYTPPCVPCCSCLTCCTGILWWAMAFMLKTAACDSITLTSKSQATCQTHVMGMGWDRATNLQPIPTPAGTRGTNPHGFTNLWHSLQQRCCWW